jgi:hypothetical protein
MTLTLELTPELEHQLTEKASSQGLPVEAYTLHLLESILPRSPRAAALASLFESWGNEGEAGEQQETGRYLVHALDEDRLSDRKLFPPERKDESW